MEKANKKVEERASTQPGQEKKKRKLIIKEISPEELSKVSGGALACASWQGCCNADQSL